MHLDEGVEILEKCIEIHNTVQKMTAEWMKIDVEISARKDAATVVYNDSIKVFGERRVFETGEVIYYKGIKINLT